MERFNALSRGSQIMFVAGLLLLVDTFLPWQDFDIEVEEGLTIDTGFSWNAWHGFWGILLGLPRSRSLRGSSRALRASTFDCPSRTPCSER